MSDIIDNLRTVWDLPFAREVILVGATAVLTHFFDMRKIKKERHGKYKDTIGENIASALIAVREVALSTKSIEIYQHSIDNSPANNTNAIKESVYYPAFMTNKDTLLKMCTSVSEARGKHEPYLDLMSAAYLYVFERYLMNLALYVGKHSYHDELDTLGCVLIIDIQKWEEKFDRHLVKRINQPHYRLFSRHGWIWKIAKHYVEKKYLLNTELNEMMKISADMVKEESEEVYA